MRYVVWQITAHLFIINQRNINQRDRAPIATTDSALARMRQAAKWDTWCDKLLPTFLTLFKESQSNTTELGPRKDEARSKMRSVVWQITAHLFNINQRNINQRDRATIATKDSALARMRNAAKWDTWCGKLLPTSMCSYGESASLQWKLKKICRKGRHHKRKKKTMRVTRYCISPPPQYAQGV